MYSYIYIYTCILSLSISLYIYIYIYGYCLAAEDTSNLWAAIVRDDVGFVFVMCVYIHAYIHIYIYTYIYIYMYIHIRPSRGYPQISVYSKAY